MASWSSIGQRFFATPPDVAARMIMLADLRPRHAVLEPSAGAGALLWAVAETRLDVDVVAVEIDGALADRLREEFPKVRVYRADFLGCGAALGTFDRVVMSPPFVHGADLAHVAHAAALLRPRGRLVALVSESARCLLRHATIESLPASTFPGVRAAILVMEAAADR